MTSRLSIRTASHHISPLSTSSFHRGVRAELLAWLWSLLCCRRTVGRRVRIGRFEADRIERHVSGNLFLVEVRSRPTIELALKSVDRVKQRRLAVMARDLATRTGESVTVVVEAVEGVKVVRKVLGIVHPKVSAHN